MSVFGFCKNKCKHDVYTVDETNDLLSGKASSNHTHDDRYYTETEINNKLANYKLKGDFAILTGEVTVSASSGGISATLNYPSGFSKDNCVVISFGNSCHSAKGYSYGHTSDSSTGIIQGTNDQYIELGSSGVIVWYNNINSSDTKFKYKIVLMKV